MNKLILDRKQFIIKNFLRQLKKKLLNLLKKNYDQTCFKSSVFILCFGVPIPSDNFLNIVISTIYYKNSKKKKYYAKLFSNIFMIYYMQEITPLFHINCRLRILH